MMKIGEFSGVTGLSVKALRHYDEKGVLVPSEVDDQSGYRKYGEGQVRAGVMIKALRDAGVPLPAVAVALTADADDALEAHRRRVLDDRAREDRAFAAGQLQLRALAAPVPVFERTMDAQPFVARALTIHDDDLLSDDDANAASGELYGQLRSAGLGPSGEFWTTLRVGDDGTAELLLCWPTAEALDPDWGGTQALVGVLPSRTELVASWQPEEGEVLPEGGLHPAVVALFDSLGERDVTPDRTEIRQTVVGEGVEVSLTITERESL